MTFARFAARLKAALSLHAFLAALAVGVLGAEAARAQVTLLNVSYDTPDAVYEHPATPFVYGFLGTVNLFHGRAHDGRLLVGEAVLDAPEHGAARNAGAVAYARPHELEVGRYSPGAPGIVALLERALVVGPSARLELKRTDTGEHIEAEILADDYRRLGLRHGERLVVRPRKLRVFLDPPAEAKT
jgi:sulfate/thiosulfate transport system ATP-binding protein